MEAILLQHPGIMGIAIVGIPDARLTEMAIACIQLRENWIWSNASSKHSAKNGERILSSEILRNYCKEKNITGYVFYIFSRSMVFLKIEFHVLQIPQPSFIYLNLYGKS